MNESKFKKGDIVLHKTNSVQKMIIIGNGKYGLGSPKNMLGNTDPNSYICRFLNDDLQNIDKQYNDYELELRSE